MRVDPLDLEDPEAWLAGLREAYGRSLDQGAESWRAARAAVIEGTCSAVDLAKAALIALQTMADGDPTSLGMAACDALREHGGAAEIVGLQQARSRLPGRPGLRDWRVDADAALVVMQARAKGVCTCAAEASQGAAPYAGLWRVESQIQEPEYRCTRMKVHCNVCGSVWMVRREDSYHYPIFAWSRSR